MSEKGEMLVFQCKVLGLPPPTLEHKFHPTRRWRFDCAWSWEKGEMPKLAVEIEGLTFRRHKDGSVQLGGRHVSATGFLADCEKYAEAAILGWHVIRVTPRHVERGEAVAWVERFFKAHGIITAAGRG